MTADAPIDIGNLITSAPGVQGGMPCIAGTRVPVHEIALMHAEGAPIAEIAEQFFVPVSHIHAAMAYYLVNRERVDAELADANTLHERLARERR
jgi:uncharacterized protein (DUF433 family)